ncbi:MAG: hypothetical protein ACXVRK_03560 [Gaiellaceae bacterium]
MATLGVVNCGKCDKPGRADRDHVGSAACEETRQFKPPYIPSRYLQDLANSDPAELVLRYVMAKDPTDRFQRLWMDQRLDLTVENVAWRHRDLFPPRVGQTAAARLEAAGFDVKTQTQK